LPTVADADWADRAQLESHYEKARPENSPSMVELLAQIDQEFADFAPVLKLATPVDRSPPAARTVAHDLGLASPAPCIQWK
jgi:hypothetical protein